MVITAHWNSVVKIAYRHRFVTQTSGDDGF
jgi:hypothetical protein